jgi:endogenous inhibitor of DNA gyrase (YacG/DUF329 family)
MSAGRAQSLCVLCRRRPVAPAWRPFCSERCKLQDLAHWADGAYAVSGGPADPSDDEGRDPGHDESSG